MRTVSLISFPRHCGLESSTLLEKRSIRFRPVIVTGPPLTLLQAGWLVPKETCRTRRTIRRCRKKEPKNDLYQFNLAALQIHSSNAQKNAKARENLERLSKLALYRTGALRALLNDAVERNNLSAGDNFAQQLQMSQEVTFGDYLLCLNFYRKLDEKKIPPAAGTRKTFRRKESIGSRIAHGMDESNGLTLEVVKWIEKLPAEELTTRPPLLRGRRVRQCEELDAFETLDSQGNVGRIRLPAPCISGNCHASITTRQCGHRIPFALARRRTIDTRPVRARTCPRAPRFEMESGERIRTTVAPRRRRSAHATRSAGRASPSLSRG